MNFVFKGHRSVRILAVAFFLLLLLEVDAFWIEPYRIEVTHHFVEYPLTIPLKLAHLTDLHTRGWGRREKFVVEAMKREKPDVILISGDNLSYRGKTRDVARLLQNLSAPLGVWVVRGNWEISALFKESDDRDRFPHDEPGFYRKAGAHLLVNQSAPIRNDVWIVGLDDPATGWPNAPRALRGVPKSVFTIALIHSPIFLKKLAGRVNLVLAGHTHGGQVRIPFLKPFWLPKGSGGYLSGWYREDDTLMYVSRGIGNTIMDARFLCRPEIAIITVGPKIDPAGNKF